MSTILNTNGERAPLPKLEERAGGKFHIVTAEWNRHITFTLRDGARAVLLQAGVKEENIICTTVPGTVELINAAALLASTPDAEAIIIIGTVIRGDTPHFDYVCRIAAEGTALINSPGKTPVIFGVLTTDNEAQALERAGGKLGNKGGEAAAAAVSMANLHAKYRK